MSKKIYVGNLAWNTKAPALQEIFSQFGKVASAKLMTDPETGRMLGFGIVEMVNEIDAADAIAQFNGVSWEGRFLKLRPASAADEANGTASPTRPSGSPSGGPYGAPRAAVSRPGDGKGPQPKAAGSRVRDLHKRQRDPKSDPE